MDARSHAEIEGALATAKALEAGLADLAAALMADDRTSDGLMRDLVLARYSVGHTRHALAKLLDLLRGAIPIDAPLVARSLAGITENFLTAKGTLTNAGRRLAAMDSHGEIWRRLEAESAALLHSLAYAANQE